jgi:hypothetical protein
MQQKYCWQNTEKMEHKCIYEIAAENPQEHLTGDYRVYKLKVK